MRDQKKSVNYKFPAKKGDFNTQQTRKEIGSAGKMKPKIVQDVHVCDIPCQITADNTPNLKVKIPALNGVREHSAITIQLTR